MGRCSAPPALVHWHRAGRGGGGGGGCACGWAADLCLGMDAPRKGNKKEGVSYHPCILPALGRERGRGPGGWAAGRGRPGQAAGLARGESGGHREQEEGLGKDTVGTNRPTNRCDSRPEEAGERCGAGWRVVGGCDSWVKFVFSPNSSNCSFDWLLCFRSIS